MMCIYRNPKKYRFLLSPAILLLSACTWPMGGVRIANEMSWERFCFILPVAISLETIVGMIYIYRQYDTLGEQRWTVPDVKCQVGVMREKFEASRPRAAVILAFQSIPSPREHGGKLCKKQCSYYRNCCTYLSEMALVPGLDDARTSIFCYFQNT